MSEKELEEKVYRLFSEWIEAKVVSWQKRFGYHGSNWLGNYKEFIRDAGINWDQTLNVLGVRRIEDHLGIPHRKGHIRFRDPFILGPNKDRDLEMSVDLANNILVLGIPSSK